MSLAESSVTATARLIQEVLWVGMWKDLYCFALRINMVLPDWRGIIGLGLYLLVLGPIDLKLAAQPHILKGTSSREPRHSLWYMLKRECRLPLHGCCVLGERVPKMVR